MPPEYAAFKLVYDETKAIYESGKIDVHGAMKKELGSICSRILENTAVFKDRQQTIKFMTDLGCEL